jgi:2-polyprenyl-6-methoxyphenol hydroxylase-like FAD-dependent oxidoreductase
MGPKVAIIGGGIGGLTAAVALARQGIPTELYEQAPELEEVGAGVGLWANGVTALAALGLSDKVAQLEVTVRRQGIRRPDGTWLMSVPTELVERRWGAGFVLVHRAELQQLLAAELDPTTIHLGARCIAVEDGNGAVTARFADGREAEADVLVGADGVHSVVRAALFGSAPLRYRGYVVVRGITPTGSVPLPRDAAETWGQGARFGLGPTSRERVIWYATWNAAERREDEDDTSARLRDIFGGWHDPIPAIIKATPHTTIIRNDIYDCWPTRTWGRGRVALLGDAIHPMTPDLAQGACQAIVDAATLATCLAAAGVSGAALQEYERRRRRNAAIATLMARSMGTTGQWEGRIACTARNALLRALPRPLQLRQFDLVVGTSR